jgi:hypothetical protein
MTTSPRRTEKDRRPHQMIVKVKRSMALRLPPRCLADVQTSARGQLRTLLGRFLSGPASSLASDAHVAPLPWDVLAIGVHWSKAQVPSAAPCLYDNPWLQLTVKVPLWLFVPPPLGHRLSGTLVQQDDLLGLRLSLDLSHSLTSSSSFSSLPPSDRLSRLCIPVHISREQLVKAYTWNARERSYLRTAPAGVESGGDGLPSRLLPGCDVPFHVTGHTCDADGQNYSLLGSLLNPPPPSTAR